MNYKVMERPYREDEIKACMDENGMITGIVRMELSDLIDNDFEGFLDILSEKLIDGLSLMGIAYKIVGFEGDNVLHLKVTGQVELDDSDEE